MSAPIKHKAFAVGELPAGKSRRIQLSDVEVSVFNVEGVYYAIKDTCPHQEVSLSSGTVEGTVLTCPGHVWKFDLVDGRCVKGDTDVCALTYPVVVEDGAVFVEV